MQRLCIDKNVLFFSALTDLKGWYAVKKKLNEKFINEFLIGIFLYSTKLTSMTIFFFLLYIHSFNN